MGESIFGGKLSRSEARADYVTAIHERALAVAADARQRGLRAQVRVVKTRWGRSQVWGVFTQLRKVVKADAAKKGD
mgnify:CR=1 FL=1